MSNTDEHLDASAIINKLSQQIAGLNRELAIAQVQAESRQEVIEKQKDLIDAYEEKENAETDEG